MSFHAAAGRTTKADIYVLVGKQRTQVISGRQGSILRPAVRSADPDLERSGAAVIVDPHIFKLGVRDIEGGWFDALVDTRSVGDVAVQVQRDVIVVRIACILIGIEFHSDAFAADTAISEGVPRGADGGGAGLLHDKGQAVRAGSILIYLKGKEGAERTIAGQRDLLVPEGGSDLVAGAGVQNKSGGAVNGTERAVAVKRPAGLLSGEIRLIDIKTDGLAQSSFGQRGKNDRTRDNEFRFHKVVN